MRVLLIGATGTIGSAVSKELATRHDIMSVGRNSGDLRADIADKEALRGMYLEAGKFDAVLCTAGLAAFGTLTALTDEDYQLGLESKLMGQINLVRLGLALIADAGSFTLTSGVLSSEPVPGSAAIAMVNAGVDAFARATALELDRGVRINVVSPPWVRETMEAMGMDPSPGLPAATVAKAYAASVEGAMTGKVIDARDFA